MKWSRPHRWRSSAASIAPPSCICQNPWREPTVQTSSEFHCKKVRAKTVYLCKALRLVFQQLGSL